MAGRQARRQDRRFHPCPAEPVTHVVVDKAGNHTAYAGDTKTSTPVPITKEQWWDLQGIKKE